MHEDAEQGSENELPASTIDDDMDFVDMKLYDTYRQIDGKPHSQEYLLKCRSKLTIKAQLYRQQTDHLQKEISRIELKHREQIERLRRFYETIAFGQSRSGKMVRAAMSTSSAAEQN